MMITTSFFFTSRQKWVLWQRCRSFGFEGRLCCLLGCAKWLDCERKLRLVSNFYCGPKWLNGIGCDLRQKIFLWGFEFLIVKQMKVIILYTLLTYWNVDLALSNTYLTKNLSTLRKLQGLDSILSLQTFLFFGQFEGKWTAPNEWKCKKINLGFLSTITRSPKKFVLWTPRQRKNIRIRSFTGFVFVRGEWVDVCVVSNFHYIILVFGCVFSSPKQAKKARPRVYFCHAISACLQQRLFAYSKRKTVNPPPHILETQFWLALGKLSRRIKMYEQELRIISTMKI